MIFGRPEWPARRLWFRRLVFPLVRLLAFTACPWRVVGREYLPKQGGYLLVANHASWKDPPWMAIALRLPVRYMTKRAIFDVPIVGALTWASGGFPVRRGEADRQAIETALRMLGSGEIVGFFPEGHRSEDGALIRARPGIGLLAVRSAVPVVPVGIVGTRRARVGRFWRRSVEIRVGTPFRARDLPEAVGEDPQGVADAIMRRIAALLPEEMRGRYASG